MTSANLENLVRIGTLKAEPPSRAEFDGLLASAVDRLRDAGNAELSLASRFDLAYNAAHALALAALRHAGYRSENRFVVFQALAHTLGTPDSTWRILAEAHRRRNIAEYEGVFDIEERLITDMIAAAKEVLASVKRLPTLPEGSGNA